jgi:hypothetical protein
MSDKKRNARQLTTKVGKRKIYGWEGDVPYVGNRDGVPLYEDESNGRLMYIQNNQWCYYEKEKRWDRLVSHLDGGDVGYATVGGKEVPFMILLIRHGYVAMLIVAEHEITTKSLPKKDIVYVATDKAERLELAMKFLGFIRGGHADGWNRAERIAATGELARYGLTIQY